MNLKKFLVVSLVALTQLPSFAQDAKKANPKHINCYKNVSADTKDVKIEIQDAVAMELFAKFKLRLTNNSTDYILYKPKESIFKLESGDFIPEDKKIILIQPLDKDSKVIDIKAPQKNAHVDAYKFQLSGLYKIPINAPVTIAPNFALPASANEFVAGNFKVEVVSVKKETAETSVKFKVTYTGDGVGLVEPKKISAKGTHHKTGKETVAVNDKKSDGMILYKGESDTFSASFHMEGRIVDMQFANMEVIWNDTFKESKLVTLDTVTLDLVVDPGLTAGKNK